MPEACAILKQRVTFLELNQVHITQKHLRHPLVRKKNEMHIFKPDGQITLIDFCTARQYKEKNLADTPRLGTVGYAAPEQFEGVGQTGPRTDIYIL